MEETFERVTERHGGKAAPVKHFYRRQYQIAGGNWRTIQTLLGHATIMTTEIYTHVGTKKLKTVHSNTHPRA
jgi:site-specific recombinase XerD